MVSVFPDDRKRLAPITLTGEKPVAEFELNAAFTEAFGLEPVDHFGFGLKGGQSIEEA